MPYDRHYDVACKKCEATTEISVRVWPATRYEPEDGEYSREPECEACGADLLGGGGEWNEAEPPDPY